MAYLVLVIQKMPHNLLQRQGREPKKGGKGLGCIFREEVKR